ncbi:hypothetical protein N473_17280 [Pseudoalteromonas luteoviolacea CPMOR-1]|uniref:Uncharacterized protein n=1 Tax=Pseudoalteromonas luteoviolacea CPMOR-1 TaxID=1365248 RepID=A0A167KRZ4_9GAMM|nr:retropepsin-like aspartic protease [Pseudoalteromonas luteoviolacea]KZN63182.1 hypothetical protein N473_17280 [Pseudoalteromonas luteoviolacea CPMOR-1]
MRYLTWLLLMCSLTLNVYFEWQRPNSILQRLFNTQPVPQTANTSIPATEAELHADTRQSHKPLADAIRDFNQGNILRAVNEWIDTDYPLQHLEQVYSWLEQLRGKLAHQNTQQLTDTLLFVQRVLSISPTDFTALQLEADVYFAQGEYNEAIDRYIKLLHLYPEYTQLQDIITNLITQQLAHLKTQSNWHETIAQGQIWLSEQPNSIPIIAAMVEAHLALNNALEAELLLSQLSDQQRQHQAIAPLKKALDNTAQQVERIPLVRQGEHYVLKAKIAGQDMALMIDTGASVTALTAAQFEQLAYDVSYINSRRVSTANGITEVPFYQSTGIQIGTKQRTPFEFGVMEQAHYGPGLLGMNFLRHFDFEIDQQKAELILKPR